MWTRRYSGSRPHYSRPFRGRSRNKTRWTAQIGEVTLLAGTANSVVLMSGSDAEVSTATSGECLVKRVVGALHLRPQGNVGGSVGLGIARQGGFAVPALGGFLDPLVAQQLLERDWLHTMSHDWNANCLANGVTMRYPLDIRVSRRLKEDQQLRLCMTSAAGSDTIIVTIDIRILIVIRA